MRMLHSVGDPQMNVCYGGDMFYIFLRSFFFSYHVFKLFSCSSGSSIGDFVTHSLTEPLFDFGTQGATLETCNLVEGGVMMIFLQFCPLYVENIARGTTDP